MLCSRYSLSVLAYAKPNWLSIFIALVWHIISEDLIALRLCGPRRQTDNDRTQDVLLDPKSPCILMHWQPRNIPRRMHQGIPVVVSMETSQKVISQAVAFSRQMMEGSGQLLGPVGHYWLDQLHTYVSEVYWPVQWFGVPFSGCNCPHVGSCGVF